MELDHSRLKVVAESAYNLVTKKLRSRPMPSTLRVLANGVVSAAFTGSTGPMSQVEARRTFSGVEFPGYTLEDLFESHSALKTVAQGRLRFFNVTMAFTAEDSGDTILFVCNFCPELGTFDFRVAS